MGAATGGIGPRRASSIPPAPRGIRDAACVGFAALWIATQAALVLTADSRPDAIFGFRMFSESSTIAAHLSREVAGPGGAPQIVPVVGGEWAAHDKSGELHHFRWRDRVIEGALASFDVTMHASYSASAQLARWRAALDDVAAHIPEDADTRRLLLDVTIRKNGREPKTFHFASPPR